jgi:hypothetical protein
MAVTVRSWNDPPVIDGWGLHLIAEMQARGHTVTVRTSKRNGSKYWSIDGKRETFTGPAYRAMEMVVYGRVNP